MLTAFLKERKKERSKQAATTKKNKPNKTKQNKKININRRKQKQQTKPTTIACYARHVENIFCFAILSFMISALWHTAL